MFRKNSEPKRHVQEWPPNTNGCFIAKGAGIEACRVKYYMRKEDYDDYINAKDGKKEARSSYNIAVCKINRNETNGKYSVYDILSRTTLDGDISDFVFIHVNKEYHSGRPYEPDWEVYIGYGQFDSNIPNLKIADFGRNVCISGLTEGQAKSLVFDNRYDTVVREGLVICVDKINDAVAQSVADIAQPRCC